ncbi:MAG: ATP-binding protein [Fimbriimonadales bacterium]
MRVAETGTDWTDRTRLVFLLEAARQFGSTLDEQRIYAALQHLISDAMPMDGLIVSSFDPVGELIHCEYGWSDGQILDVGILPPIPLNVHGKGMQSKVIVTGNAEIFDVARKVREPETNYVEMNPGRGPVPVSEEPRSHSAMMAPMMLDGQVTGVVQVMCDRADAYGDEDLSVLEAVVLQMTAAWHHARLYRKAEEDRRLIDRIVATSPDLIYIFDLRTTTSTFSNGRMARSLGYEPEEFERLSLTKILHPDDLVRIAAVWARFETAADGETFETEYRVQNKAGEWRWFLSLDTPFERDENNRVVKILGIGLDVTSRKEFEEDLERRVAQRTAELEEAVKELEGFTYSVSHDLRGPLRAISAASMILREDYCDSLPEEAREHLHRQADAAKRMGTLIDDLLKLSRIGRQELTPSRFDLSELTLDVAKELDATDRMEIQPEMMAFGDPRLIRYILLNLIENGLKFSAGEGLVRVGQSNGAFYVADSGIGFEMKYASKLFRPFERLVREEEYPGTGIGLANAHRIVQRHGGRIWVESEPGKGSTFYFTLPGKP